MKIFRVVLNVFAMFFKLIAKLTFIPAIIVFGAVRIIINLLSTAGKLVMGFFNVIIIIGAVLMLVMDHSITFAIIGAFIIAIEAALEFASSFADSFSEVIQGKLIQALTRPVILPTIRNLVADD